MSKKQIDEISNDLKQRYLKKSMDDHDAANMERKYAKKPEDRAAGEERRKKRAKGISRAFAEQFLEAYKRKISYKAQERSGRDHHDADVHYKVKEDGKLYKASISHGQSSTGYHPTREKALKAAGIHKSKFGDHYIKREGDKWVKHDPFHKKPGVNEDIKEPAWKKGMSKGFKHAIPAPASSEEHPTPPGYERVKQGSFNVLRKIKN